MSYTDNRAFGDRFLPQVSAILGQLFIVPAVDNDDWYHESDLMVLDPGNYRYAVRCRKHYVYENKRWRNQVTIRFALHSGKPTEFDKIVYNGWGDVFMYGIADATERYLEKWTAGRLDAFRTYCLQCMFDDRDGFISKHFESNPNPNDSDFLAFDIGEIPGFIIADSEHWDGWGKVKTGGK